MMEMQRLSNREAKHIVLCGNQCILQGAHRPVSFSQLPTTSSSERGASSDPESNPYAFMFLLIFSIRQTDRQKNICQKKINKNIKAYELLSASPVISPSIHHIVHEFHTNLVDSYYSWWVF